MTTASLTLGSAGNQERVLSRREQLEQAGVPIMPEEMWQDHVQNELVKNRIGIWRYLWPIPTVCMRMSDPRWFLAAALCLYASIIAHKSEQLGLVGIPLLLGGIGYFVPFVANLVLGLWAARTPGNLQNMLDAGSHWYKAPIRFSDEEAVPAHLLERVTQAKEVVGVEPYFLKFRDDPLIMVSNGWFRKPICIGAYNTNDPKLDKF